MKKEKQSTYWKNLHPIWWSEIKSWFGWGDRRQTITTIIMFIGISLLLIFSGRTDLVIDDVWLRVAALVFGALWFLIVSILSFVNANQKLHDDQKRIQDEQTSRITELENNKQEDPFEFILSAIEYSHRNNERACAFLLVRNISEFDVEDCYLKARTQTMNNLTPLSWSENNPVTNLEYGHITIRPGDVWRSDIVVAWKNEENAVLCIFPLSKNDRIILPGTYPLTISALGKINGHYTEHKEEYLLVYQGENKLALKKGFAA